MNESDESERLRDDERDPQAVNNVCPVCGEPLFHEKCKVVCKSSRCVYRIVFNCAEF